MKRIVPAGFFLVILFSCLAGCTGQTNVTTGDALLDTGTGLSPERSLLLPAEVPDGFVQSGIRVKNSSEMSSLALELGWRGGYLVQYESTGKNGTAPAAVITQNIAIYPREKMEEITAIIRKAASSGSGYSITELPDPGIGELSSASVAFIAGPQEPANATASEDLFSAAGNSRELGLKRSGDAPVYYEIIFTRGDVLEVIRMTGPSADYQTTASLARTAYNKL